VDLTPDCLKLTADNPDLGVCHQEIEVDFKGEPLVAGFNATYLLDALTAMSSERVALYFQGELDPCIIRPVGAKYEDKSEYLSVVMPMRI
jgi:DNA polymerase-3 subunit beta